MPSPTSPLPKHFVITTAAFLCAGSLVAGAYIWQASTLPLAGADMDGPAAPENVKDQTSQQGDKDKANSVQVDIYGDPLPPGAMARLGTVRFRSNRNSVQDIVFTPDSKSIGLLSMGEAPRLWNVKTGEPVRQFAAGLRGQRHVGAWVPLSANGYSMAYRTRRGNSWHSGVWWTENKPGFHVRDAATGKMIRTFEQTRGEYQNPCAISPDGNTLVAFLNGALRLWDIDTGQQIWEQKMERKDSSAMRSLVFSPDAKLVAIGISRGVQPGTKGGGIYLHDARTGKFLRTLGHLCELASSEDSLSFSPDGRTVAAVYIKHPKRNSNVHLWDVVTGKQRSYMGKDGHSYSHPAFAPDSKMIALYDFSRTNSEIGLYEVATGKKLGSCWLYEVSLTGAPGSSLNFSPDGKILASTSRLDSLIRYWDVHTGKILAIPSFGHESPVSSVAFAADGRTLVSGGENGSVHLWDSYTGQKQRTLSEESSLRSRHNKALLTGEIARVVSANGKIVAGVRMDLPPPDEKLSSIHPRQAEKAILENIRDNIYIWNTATGQEINKIKLNFYSSSGFMNVRQLSLSPDGKFLAAWLLIGNANIVRLWEVDSGKQMVEKLEGSNPIFSPDSKCLLTQRSGVFTLWETATAKKISVATGVEFENWPQLVVTPDWQNLIGFSRDKKNQKSRWYLNSLHLDKQFKLSLGRPRYFDGASQYGPNRLAVSPDGKMMAWSHNDGIIHLVETATGVERARFEGHSGTIRSLSFSPDNRRLASGSNDTTILVWDVTCGHLDGHGELCVRQLTAQQMNAQWADLASDDATLANRAIWSLASVGQPTAAFLMKRLLPVPVVTAKTLAQLIADLDSETFAVRQKARQQLETLGELAEPSLRQVLEKKPSVEVRHSVHHLLDLIEVQRAKGKPTGEALRMLRAIEVLEHIGTSEAKELLEQLASGAPGARQTEEAKASVERLAKKAAQR